MNLQTSRRPLFRRFSVSFILCLFLLPPSFVSSGALAQAQQSSNVAPPAAPVMVKLPVVVMNDKRQLIEGLTKDDFSVWEGKQEHEINYFQSSASPASVAVLIDVSEGIRPRTLVAVKHALAKFIELARAENEYFVSEFSEGQRELTGWTRDAVEVVRGLEKLAVSPQAALLKPKPGGQAAFYDACAATLDALGARSNSARVLLLFTDALDDQSRLTFGQLRRKAIASDVQIYVLGMGEVSMINDGERADVIFGQRLLGELAFVSGGGSFFADDPADRKEMEKGLTRIAAELRHQYIIGFIPASSAPDGKLNKIKVTLRSPKHKRLILRSREGYFSPLTATKP
ncbi:MAG TPA: VWA domain-containing protein [Pyrinomonadaceae bacterium]|nr:VWA domain-containing protein [Pyrinomonadaceae bacterium]